MTCPNCSVENKAGVRFCGSCGEKLQLGSSQGGDPVNSAATTAKTLNALAQSRRFCGTCGGEVRADGSCMRCSVPLRTPSRISPSIDSPVNGTLPKLPSRSLLLACGGFLLMGFCIYAGKILWGESLLVRTNVPGAAILVDGEEKVHLPADGAMPLSIKHLHGKLHTVVVKAPGYQDASRDVIFPYRVLTPLQLYLTPKPATVRIQGLPGSYVYLNNGFAGRTNYTGSWTSPPLPASRYLIAVRQEGRVEWTSDLTLKPGEAQNLSASQPEAALTPEQKRAKAFELLNSAQQKFLQRQYGAALSDCEAGLALDSGIPQGIALCQQIRDAVTASGGQQ